jgi:hypothetical protein
MKSFAEFYPFYLRQHSHPVCRALHFTGTTGVIALVLVAVITGDWRMAAWAPLAGYGFAWLGHLVFEKNRPATFRYPLWSLRADFVMYGQWLAGSLPEKLTSALK